MGESQAAGPAPAPGGNKANTSSVRLKRAELRRHPRFHADEAKAQLHVRGFLTKIGLGGKNQAKEAVNLSEGGIMVLTHSKLQPGTKVQVRLEIEKYNDLIEAQGEIRWCAQSAKEESHYYAGIRFSDLTPAQAALIAKMHAWYTSPEYKQKNATRRRLAPPGLET